MIKTGIKIPEGDYSNPDVISNELKYIFTYPTKSRPYCTPKPIYFYGIKNTKYPPDIKEMIEQFKQIRESQCSPLSQQVWHIIITFPFLFTDNAVQYFAFADNIAWLFGQYYPVCYAYHTDNKVTGGKHSHFHYIISTASYVPGYPALDSDQLMQYFENVSCIANQYNISLYHHQSEEELACLNLTTIFSR